MNIVIRYSIAGMVAGVISAVLLYTNPLRFWYFIGVVYGVSLLLANAQRIKPIKTVLFVLCSGVAYFLAASFFLLTVPNSYVEVYLAAGAIGCVGSSILVSAFHLLVHRLSVLSLLLLILLGIVLSSFVSMLTGSIIHPGVSDPFGLHLLSIVHLLWQVGMATGIGFAVSSSLKRGDQSKT